MGDEARTVAVFLQNDIGSPPEDVSDLPVISLDVPADARVQDLPLAAFQAAGLLEPDYHYVNFVTFPDDRGRRRLVWHLDVAVAEDGLLYWRVGPGSARTTIRDVERTAAEGLFDGDPLAYVVDRGGYGDSGIFVYWDDLLNILKEVGAVGGGAAVVAKAAQLLLRFVGRHLARLSLRHARFPSTFFNSIVRRSTWDPVQLARLLDVREREARELLLVLGYEPASDRLYRISSEPERAQLRTRLAEEHYLWDGWHDIRSPATDDEPPG